MPLDSSTQVAVNVNGQTFNIWDETVYRERWGRLGVRSGTRKIWLCAWSDRKALASKLLGGGTNIAGGTVFANGWQHPEFPQWFVQFVESEPEGKRSVGANGHIQFEYARLFIDFGPPSFDITNPFNPVGVFQVDFSQHSWPIEGADVTFEFSADSMPIDVASQPVIRFSTMSLWTTVFDRTSLNGPLINSLLDCTNNAVFGGAAVESIIFRGARSAGKWTAAGDMNEDISLLWEWHPVSGGWNKRPRANTNPLWQPYRVRGTGAKQYTPADLSQLLRM